jgi:hypothetical protein
LATNYLIKDDCYISNTSTNTTDVAGIKDCSNNPNKTDFLFNFEVGSTLIGPVNGVPISVLNNKITDIPKMYYFKIDFNGISNIITLNERIRELFSIVNNPKMTRAKDLKTSNNKFLAIKTVFSNEYLYLSDIHDQKFFIASDSSALMVLKNNSYQYLNLTTNDTGGYSLSYTPNLIPETAIIYKNNYLTGYSTTVTTTTTPVTITGKALGEITSTIVTERLSILTWVTTAPFLNFTIQNYN